MDNPQLIITILPNGSVNVTGPISNKVLCYGMLESAKDAIRDYVAKNSAVIMPAVSVPSFNGQGN